MARASTRKTTSRKKQYVPPNMLEIPQEVQYHFKKDGYKLRWVRQSLQGKDDAKNLVKRQREGWEWVQKDEIPESLQNDFEIGTGRTEGAIVNNDLVLAKIPVEIAESRQEYYEDMANSQVDAVDQYLSQNSSRNMPIHNESKSRATTGRKPAEFGAISENDED